MSKIKNAMSKFVFASLAMMASTPLWALGGAGRDSDWTPEDGGDSDMDLEQLQGFLHWLVSGPGGNIIVILGVIVALIMVVASASLRPVLFVLGLAILVGWGPGLFIWIASSGAEPDLIAAWVASR